MVQQVRCEIRCSAAHLWWENLSDSYSLRRQFPDKSFIPPVRTARNIAIHNYFDFFSRQIFVKFCQGVSLAMLRGASAKWYSEKYHFRNNVLKREIFDECNLWLIGWYQMDLEDRAFERETSTHNSGFAILKLRSWWGPGFHLSIQWGREFWIQTFLKVCMVT